MFEYIKGELTVKKIDYVALEVNGVAYKIFISLKTYDKLTENIEKLFIYTNVKEDDFSLYGFKTESERELFKALVSISGVGPKLGLAILSTFNTKEVIDIVIEENVKFLVKVPGLGQKKAQKLIVDLKDKVKKLNVIEISQDGSHDAESSVSATKALMMKEDLKLALESLGYSNADVSKWIKDEELEKYERVEDAIKDILQKIQSK
ncbi:Holliday junction branch migration protein RuvA [Sebaldella sp. S0638]|uniref:Holliday junction branch migration protein RuvA n=1 Tax=Sebaldella sp. S0638 TaxID=2957809 RepID=UPI0020A07284|nr:Holliday junction branch migration protein RuvA [Sebaldella sp. S0638]MCP1224156.1 Holliday junction branch migration protein RuvA [Sebaldella sp. S0638]